MDVNNEAVISTLENNWRMTRYMRGFSVPRFAYFLGSVGVVTSLNLILDALNLLVLEPGQTADSLCDSQGNCLSPRLVRVYHIIADTTKPICYEILCYGGRRSYLSSSTT